MKYRCDNVAGLFTWQTHNTEDSATPTCHVVVILFELNKQGETQGGTVVIKPED